MTRRGRFAPPARAWARAAGAAGGRARRDERGELPVTLMVFPGVILAFYCAVHAALVFHGREVVAAAAQDGLRAAQIEGGTAADGQAAADQTLQLSPGLRNVAVVVDIDDDTITVRVTAKVDTLLAEQFNTVSAVAVGPKERFYSEAERR